VIAYRQVERRHAPEALAERSVDAAAEHARAAPPAAAAVDWWTERLIEAGELEAGVVDALSPERDGLPAAAGALRRLSLAAARGLAVAHALERRARAGVPAADAHPSAARAHAALAAAAHVAAVAVRDAAAAMPDEVPVGVPEGFAYYGLYPEVYAAAARQFAARVGPPRVLVVGVRSIGTGLSAVVADTLARRGVDVRSVTVRPRGHPSDRAVDADDALDRVLRDAAGGWVAVVDEGPGLSGSSLAGTAAALAARGVDDARIVLFPSWDADGQALGSEAARARWPRHRRFVGSFEQAVLGRGALHGGDVGPASALDDLSAGAWRDRHWHADDPARPATHPQHEARKYRHAGDDAGEGARWLTFAGLGAYGRARAALAERLAGAGHSPRVLGLRRGFLATAEHAGRPLGAADADGPTLDAMAAYVAWRRRHLPAERTVSLAALADMTAHNAGLALGEAYAGRARAATRLAAALEAAPVCHVDGRMQPHEWVRGPGGLVKTDAVAHGDDHFLPGAQDAAWDVAGACVEWQLPPEARARFVAAYRDAAGDPTIDERLRFHEAAYLAFRLGYATLGARGLGGHAEAARLGAAAAGYAERLRALLDAPADARPDARPDARAAG
jgi:hypothetical protein